MCPKAGLNAFGFLVTQAPTNLCSIGDRKKNGWFGFSWPSCCDAEGSLTSGWHWTVVRKICMELSVAQARDSY